MTLETLKSDWQDLPEYHRHINELFADLVDKDDVLKGHRDFVQNHIFGMGERSFWWLWKILLEELSDDPNLLEIGCLKGATLSLWRLLKPNAHIIGVTPLNTAGGVWESDYAADIAKIHEQFDLKHPGIINGYSQEDWVVDMAKQCSPFDVVYIDGSHEYGDVLLDLLKYAPMVKQGGYLVMDDCCCDFHMPPQGGIPINYFQGIRDVQDAFDDYMKEYGGDWEFVFSVVHLRVLQRK